MDRKSEKISKKTVKLKIKGFNFLNYEKTLGELEIDVSKYTDSFKKEEELELTKSLPGAKVKLEITVQ